jgi:hypothetical protein
MESLEEVANMYQMSLPDLMNLIKVTFGYFRYRLDNMSNDDILADRYEIMLPHFCNMTVTRNKIRRKKLIKKFKNG